MPTPRFLLVLSAQSNLLRASLVTRELKNVAFARQTFQVTPLENGMQEFDPAEAWYKMKKVIAACLDIGRTLSREIAGVAIVGESNARVIWCRQADEVVSKGTIEPVNSGLPQPDAVAVLNGNPALSGTLAAWLLWNLMGGVTSAEPDGYGSTHVRAPFDAKLPILAVSDINAGMLMSSDGQGDAQNDPVLEAAGTVWRKL